MTNAICDRGRLQCRAWLVLALAALAILGIAGCAADAGYEEESGASVQELQSHKPRKGSRHCPEDKVRICHFEGKKHSAKIMEIPEQALAAHLAHGDGLAPDSVETNADCLVPHPPPEPVSASGTTGEDGVARFVIPETNIRVVAAVTDENGVSLPSINLTLLTAGGDYLLIGQDLGLAPSYAPASVEGSLLDARPGSAPTIAANIVMQLFNSTFPGGGLLDPGGTIPEFIVNQFVSTSDACFTEAEFRRLLRLLCQGGIRVTVSILAGVTGAPKLVSFVLPRAASLAVCPSLAASGAANTFQGLSFPLRIRQYEPPFLPGVPVPVYFEVLGPCGGACCSTSNTNDCSNTSRAGTCATGVYSEGTYCSADACECPTGTVECTGGICVADTCGGGASMNPATCMCDCGPGKVDCQGVCTSYQCSGGKVLSPTSCLCECPAGTTECNGQCIAQCTNGQTLNTTTCACECPSGTVTCGGQCVSNTCPPGEAFEDLLCRCVPCPPGTAQCNGQCVSNCTNGRVLDPTACSCECPSGTGLCGDQCVSMNCQADYAWEPLLCRCVPCLPGDVVCGGQCVSACSDGRVLDPATCACECPGGTTWDSTSQQCQGCAGLSVSPSTGSPGAEVFVTASGYAANEVVDILFGGQWVGGSNQPNSPYFDHFYVPAATAGTYRVDVIGNSSGTRNCGLFVVP